MSLRFYGYWFGALAAAAGVMCVSGCQLLPPTGHERASSPAGDSGPKLTASQVADIHVAKGCALEKGGDPEAAATAYREALKHDPTRLDACLRLAILDDGQGKFKEALELYRKAQAGQPNNPDILCDIGYSFYLQHSWLNAETNLRQALVLDPHHPRAHNNLGLVLAHTGRCEEALVEFHQAGCQEAEAQANLAFVLTLEKQWPEAHKHYEAALASDASSTAARQGLHDVNKLMAWAEPPRQPDQQICRGEFRRQDAPQPSPDVRPLTSPRPPAPEVLPAAMATNDRPQITGNDRLDFCYSKESR